MSRHLLSLHDVTLAFGGDSVLEGVSLNLESGMRACVTGRNGEGKSTLLKVIAGRLEPDRGEIIRAPGLKTAFLEQEVTSRYFGSSGKAILAAYRDARQHYRQIVEKG